MRSAAALLILFWAAAAPAARGQAIEVPYRGLRYSVLSKGGVTVMIAPLDRTILEYSTAQVWVSNGSDHPVRVSPESFSMRLDAPGSNEPRVIRGTPEGTVVTEVLRRARAKDMLQLVRAYETVLFGMVDEHTYSYYQKRKEAALATAWTGKMRAAATASAIVLAEKTLRPGEFVDGTIFFRAEDRTARLHSLSANIAGDIFEFPQADGPRDAK